MLFPTKVRIDEGRYNHPQIFKRLRARLLFIYFTIKKNVILEMKGDQYAYQNFDLSCHYHLIYFKTRNAFQVLLLSAAFPI